MYNERERKKERESERASKDNNDWGRAMINLTLSAASQDDDDNNINGNQHDWLLPVIEWYFRDVYIENDRAKSYDNCFWFGLPALSVLIFLYMYTLDPNVFSSNLFI